MVQRVYKVLQIDYSLYFRLSPTVYKFVKSFLFYLSSIVMDIYILMERGS